MLVIGAPESRFRVNVGPTNSDVAQENYGLIHDLSGIPPAPAGQDAGRPKAIFKFCRMKFESPRGPCRQHG